MPKIIVTKQEWIEEGFKQFSKHGEHALIVEKMANKLKVNKSSFYWYFKTKQVFINEIVSYWVFKETEQIINSADKFENPKEKWNEFLIIAFRNDPYLEFIFYLKRYATKHASIQKIIDEIDSRRLDFTSKLLQELGYLEKESIIKASLFYKYLIGYHEMIRYKEQKENYIEEVKNELSHFISILK